MGLNERPRKSLRQSCNVASHSCLVHCTRCILRRDSNQSAHLQLGRRQSGGIFAARATGTPAGVPSRERCRGVVWLPAAECIISLVP